MTMRAFADEPTMFCETSEAASDLAQIDGLPFDVQLAGVDT